MIRENPTVLSQVSSTFPKDDHSKAQIKCIKSILTIYLKSRQVEESVCFKAFNTNACEKF